MEGNYKGESYICPWHCDAASQKWNDSIRAFFWLLLLSLLNLVALFHDIPQSDNALQFVCLSRSAWCEFLSITFSSMVDRITERPCVLMVDAISSILTASGTLVQISLVVVSSCVCQYTGSLVDGPVFNSSIQHGRLNTLASNNVIAVWIKDLQKMTPGDKWIITITSGTVNAALVV